MQVGQATHVGLVREGNEDALLVLAESSVVAVADGLGGHAAGEVASALAVESLRASLAGLDGAEQVDVGRILGAALVQASEVVADAGREPSRSGMGTTAVVAHVRPGTVWIGHVGDSRAYLLSGGELTQLTTDHQSLGRITQALGLGRVEPDLLEAAVSPGDRLLLCTDGLTNTTDDGEIARRLGAGEPQQACDALVAAALAGGGVDNVTVVVVDPQENP